MPTLKPGDPNYSPNWDAPPVTGPYVPGTGGPWTPGTAPTGPPNTTGGFTNAPTGTLPDEPYTPTRGDFALIRRVLDEAGLGSLYDWAVDQMVNGAFEDENQLYFALRETPEFRQRFRGIFEFEQKFAGVPGVRPPSVQEVLAFERQAYELMRAADFPPGFYDSADDFQSMIGAGVSYNELQQRVAIYTEAAGAGREDIRAELARFNQGSGIEDAVDAMSDGDLAAWLLDSDRGLQAVRQRLSSAEVSAAARQVGFGALTYDEATTLVGQGIEAQQARQAFGELAQAGDITGTLAGEDPASGMARDAQLGVVRGVGESLAEFEARRRRRQGAFQGGGGFSTGQEGVAGIGSA